MNKYFGPAVAATAAAILAFSAFYSKLPGNLDLGVHILAVSALVIVSVLIGIASQFIAILTARRSERERTEAVDFADSLQKRLTPLTRTLLEEQLRVGAGRIQDLIKDYEVEAYVFIQ